MRQIARTLFANYLEKADSSAHVEPAYMYANKLPASPMRAGFVHQMEESMQALDPNWRDMLGKSRRLRVPENASDVQDAEMCLAFFAKTKPSQRSQFVSRYEELGGDRNNSAYLQCKVIDVLRGYGPETGGLEALDNLTTTLLPEQFRKWARSQFEKFLGKESGERRDAFAMRVLAKYVATAPDSLDRTRDMKFLMHTISKVGATGAAPVLLEYAKFLSHRDKSENVAYDRLRQMVGDNASVMGGKYLQLVNVALGAGESAEKAVHVALKLWAEDILS
jgi:hypothetical protein